MKNRKTNLLVYGVAISFLLLASCKKPKKEEVETAPETPKKVFILNEGNFGSTNASVSMLDLVTSTLYNDLFGTANNRVLGDVLQSMTQVNNKSYFVVNNSNKIEITNSYPLTSVGVISGFSLPRYMIAVSATKAYVSEYIDFSGGNGRLSIVDLTSNTITGSITVGKLPENMLLHNGRVYVCNSGDTKVSVINPVTDLVESEITLADGPNSLVLDINSKLWVLCGGKVIYDPTPPYAIDLTNSIAGAVVRIEPASNTVEATYSFSNKTGSPSGLVINGGKNTLYYKYNSAVYSQNITATSTPSIPLINRSFYGLGVDPVTNYIYTGTYGFTSNQKMIRYTPAAIAIDSFTVGVGPNGFVFNY